MTAILQNGPTNRIADAGGTGGTGLALRDAGGISVFDRIADPMTFVSTMGKALAQAGVGGAKTVAQGECLAFACLCKRMDPFEFSAQYHLIDGKPQLQAHAILARMKKAGAKVRWLNDGEDLVEAVAEFDIENEKTVVKYTTANAQLSGCIKDGSAWKKTPAAMLRAAMTRKAAKMLMPEILVGDVDPEEFASDESASSPVVVVRSAEEIAKRRAELEAAETVVDVTPAYASDQPPFDVTKVTGDSANDMTTVLLDIEATLTEAGQNKADLESKLGKPLDSLTLEGAQTLLGRLRQMASQKK